MKLNNTYSFSADNQIGKFQGKLQTPLVEGQTVKGEPVVALCLDDSFIPRKDGSTLVSKDKEGKWQPIATIKDLEKIVSSTNKDKLGEQIGIWKDSRHLLIKGRDGIPQDREVKAIQAHWNENALTSVTEYDDLGVRNQDPNAAPQRMAVGWSFVDATIGAKDVTVSPAAFPGKQVGVLEEPLHVSSHQILRVTDFDDQSYYTPTAVESILHREGAPTKTTPKADYDLAPLIFGNAPVTYVIPS